MMKKWITTIIMGLQVLVLQAQFQIGAPLYIESGAEITVINMDVNSTSTVHGAGAIRLKNTINTDLNCNNNQLPNLIIDGSLGTLVNVTSPVQINNSIQFINGKLNVTNNDVILNHNASINGASNNSYIITNGTGKLVKNVNTNLTNFVMPVGNNNNYEPISFTTSGTYASGANLSARVINMSHPNKPIQNTDYLNNYWPLSRTGITGSVNAAATYVDPTDINGTESNIKAVMYAASNWDNLGNTNNTTTNTNGAELVANSGDLYGMNSFVQIKAKAFLQGAYNATSLKMADNLRTPTNLIPLSDPYRVAPYNTSFTHINNASVETANAAVFNNQTNTDDNIVDWVFVELRNSAVGAPGSNKIKTRSALIQRDGDIVDVDGVSPLFLKDVPPGLYTIAIRHRNHIGLSTDPITNLQDLNMKTPTNITDFTSYSDAQLFGSADVNYKIQGAKNLLYAGNANSNNRISLINLNNDKDKIFLRLGNQANNLSVNNVYDAADINMNRNVRFINLNNDKDFLFSILGNSLAGVKNQVLP